MQAPGVKRAVNTTLFAAFLCLLVGVLQYGVGVPVYAAPSTHTVVIEAMKFVPETITVKRGDTVVWVNKDLFPHTATTEDRTVDSGELAPNQSWKYTLSKSGKFAYICTLHPTMKATLIVE